MKKKPKAKRPKGPVVAKPRNRQTEKGKSARLLRADIDRLTHGQLAVHASLLDLQFVLRELHEIASAEPGASPAAAIALAVTGQSVQITFKKKAGSPDHVRITLLDTNPPEEVLSPNQSEGTAVRKVGDRFNARMEVKGNFGETATVDIGKALPVFMSMSAFPGSTGNAGTKPMKVTG